MGAGGGPMGGSSRRGACEQAPPRLREMLVRRLVTNPWRPAKRTGGVDAPPRPQAAVLWVCDQAPSSLGEYDSRMGGRLLTSRTTPVGAPFPDPHPPRRKEKTRDRMTGLWIGSGRHRISTPPIRSPPSPAARGWGRAIRMTCRSAWTPQTSKATRAATPRSDGATRTVGPPTRQRLA